MNTKETPLKRRLKSKENILKSKCRKSLKNKLKKYKLKRDGQEDQDVLDVSKTFHSLLIIRSPVKELSLNNNIDLAEYKPTNYLIKMVRNKRNNNKLSSNDIVEDFEEIPPMNSSPEKKHTNAFKLLMGSRNKSIGTNSPGKEKIVIDTYELQEIAEKRNVKVKRNLALQKLAEAKGFFEKKRKDEIEEEIIQEKMTKRAERLKAMLLKDSTKNSSKHKKSKKKTDTKVEEANLPIKEIVDNDIPSKTLQLIDIFNEVKDCDNIPLRKEIIENEDKEFLKKLSPSIKKKENMLSYFKEIDKPTESSDDITVENLDDSPIIKVKFNSRSKKTKKIKIKNREVDNIGNENDLSECLSDKNPADLENLRKKRKRKVNVVPIDSPENNPVNGLSEEHHERPKRSVKRPVKYSDDVQLCSSDEEMHIFTPKKKKNLETKKISNNNSVEAFNQVATSKNNKLPSTKNTEKKKQCKTTEKTSVKLAPIFAVKPQLTPAEIEAKRNFLHSGVPEQIKKIAQKQVKPTREDYFNTVIHVQQNKSGVVLKKQYTNSLNIEIDEGINSSISITEDEMLFRTLLCKDKDMKKDTVIAPFNYNVPVLLRNIKESYPRFPVYRTFKTLKNKSKGEFNNLNFSGLDNSIEVINSIIDFNNDSVDKLKWTDKYKPMSAEQIIGNFETIKELKKWLVSWTEFDVKMKSKNANGSDSSDFYLSDTDSRDSMRNTNNLLVLSGPVGTGKTSSVYAVAAELAIKVIEVNASSKRTGKVMLQDLQEATQSHKVNRATGSSENSQKSQSTPENCQNFAETNTVINLVKKRGRPRKVQVNDMKPVATYSRKNKIELKPARSVKKENNMKNELPASQETTNGRTAMSLILIDDADIIFDQDDGFCSAISQLVHCSKRPVILVTSALNCPHLQKFVQCGKVLKLRPLSPRILGTWVDLMCLSDSGLCCPGDGAKFLDYFRGDIRKTINYLHFFMSFLKSDSKDKEYVSQNGDYTPDIEDETSCMSWASQEGPEDKQLSIAGDGIWKCYSNIHLQIQNDFNSLSLFDVWWSLPTLLDMNAVKQKICEDKKKEDIKALQLISKTMDSLSLADYFSSNNSDSRSNVCSSPWYSSEDHSVSENEYNDNFNKNHEICEHISYSVISSSIRKTQNSLSLENKTDLTYPSMENLRERDRIISRHHNVSSFLNPSTILDRRALALDYWSTTREICRLEKNKTDNNMKRNNRFCHYLKSCNIQCSSDTLEKLADSLI